MQSSNPAATSPPAPPATIPLPQRLSAAVAGLPNSAVRELLRDAQRPGMISLAGGLPSAALFDVEGLLAAARALFATAPRVALQYGPTEGQAALREQLSALLRARGIDAAPERILVTTGSQQGLDLVARALLDPGDRVAIERPSYLAALQAFSLAGARFVTVPGDAEGMRVDLLEEAMAGGPPPKLVYLVANFANPTGATLSRARRLELLRFAVRHGVFVLEDDPYGELRFRGEPVPPLLALAREVPGAADWCGYLSTLSKIVAPGLRIGWTVLPAPLHEAAARAKQAVDLHTSSFVQELAAVYLAGGRLEAHRASVRAAYREQCETLCAALAGTFGASLEINCPAGGMFLWGRFVEPIDTQALLGFARQAGVIFVPGAAFYADAPDRGTLRLSFVTVPPPQLREGVERLAAALAALGRPHADARVPSP